MTITAKILAASAHPHGGPPLYSVQLRYPKFIHGEGKTHRLIRIADKAYELLQEVGFMDDPNLSRNASSSRAIPVERMIADVMDDPVIPVIWYKNKPGMQGTELCSESESQFLVDEWLAMRNRAVSHARRMMDGANAHKQHINRLLEPWLHINVVVTATEWSNFFALRCHPDAQPEMRVLAENVREAIAGATPRVLQPGEWHLPYVTPRQHESGADEVPMNLEQAIKVSVARCARVSYLTQDGKVPTVEQDLALYDRLAASVPLHASPCEHQATPDTQEWIDAACTRTTWEHSQLHGNLRGWIQYRKTLPGECQ